MIIGLGIPAGRTSQHDGIAATHAGRRDGSGDGHGIAARRHRDDTVPVRPVHVVGFATAVDIAIGRHGKSDSFDGSSFGLLTGRVGGVVESHVVE